MNDPSKNIPTNVATSEQWISWHNALSGWFSKKDANDYWIRFWHQRAGAGSQADTVELRAYMREKGVELTTDWSGSVADGISDIGAFISDTFKLIRNIFFGAVILVIALIVYFLISGIKQGKSPGQMLIDARTLGATSKLKAIPNLSR